MKLNVEELNVEELTGKELKLINGGGPWWHWLGETCRAIIDAQSEVGWANIQ